MRTIDVDKLYAQSQDLCKGIACMSCPFLNIEDSKCELESMILQAPTVGTERHAHWEWDDELGMNYCSSCGRPTYDSHDEYIEFMGRKVLALVAPYYCGYCGAKMDEAEECIELA